MKKDLLNIEQIQEIFNADVPIEAKPCPEDIFGREAYDDVHDGSLGITRNIVDYVICLRDDGRVLHGMEKGGKSSSNYAYTQTVETEGEKIYEFLERKGVTVDQVAFVIEYEYYLHDWSGSELIDEKTLTFYSTVPIDWDKVRRRVENRLRHDLEFVKVVALNNAINIY